MPKAAHFRCASPREFRGSPPKIKPWGRRDDRISGDDVEGGLQHRKNSACMRALGCDRSPGVSSCRKIQWCQVFQRVQSETMPREAGRRGSARDGVTFLQYQTCKTGDNTCFDYCFVIFLSELCEMTRPIVCAKQTLVMRIEVGRCVHTSGEEDTVPFVIDTELLDVLCR